MYPAHIYTTQYKETKLHQSSKQKCDVGDDSDDEDFEPSLNFTLRFVMQISYVSVITYILEIFSFRLWSSFKKFYAGITSWSTVTGCPLPKSELIFICC
jgi:hypothetical protein